MVKKVYYVENSLALEMAIAIINEKIPCFIERKYIEMNFSELSIVARAEDVAFVEKILAPLI